MFCYAPRRRAHLYACLFRAATRRGGGGKNRRRKAGWLGASEGGGGKGQQRTGARGTAICGGVAL
jgi:hypothetical protein